MSEIKEVEVQVLLLDTDKASNLSFGLNGLLVSNNYPQSAITNKNDDFTNQLYYVLSNEQRGERGWNYNFGLSKIDFLEYSYEKHSTEWNCCFKIIATNDDERLGIVKYTEGGNVINGGRPCLFPQLSNEGLQLICNLHNKNKELKVKAAYEYLSKIDNSVISPDDVSEGSIATLKIDDNNCITILSAKWTNKQKVEIKKIAERFHDIMCLSGRKEADKFIEENL